MPLRQVLYFKPTIICNMQFSHVDLISYIFYFIASVIILCIGENSNIFLPKNAQYPVIMRNLLHILKILTFNIITGP